LSVILKSLFLSNYSFDKYKTNKEEKSYMVVIDKKYNDIVQAELDLINNICLARDLGETPSNDLYPESFTKLVKSTKFKNTKIKVLSPKQIEKK
jgi:leucyl aminopeptidase